MLMESIPAWAVIPASLLLIAIAHECGFRLGRLASRRRARDDANITAAIASSVIGLLWLTLAFTFGWTTARFDARRGARAEEAKVIGRLFRLCDFMPPADGQVMRSLIRRYVDLSLSTRRVASIPSLLAQRDQMHLEMWRIATRASVAAPTETLGTAIVEAVNDVIDLQLQRRILLRSSRLPAGIIGAAVGLMILAVGLVGYQVGSTSPTRSPTLVPLALAMALTNFLIVDLDRPLEGLLRLRSDSLVALNEELTFWEHQQGRR